jgi:antitoxin HigA-1
MNIKREPTHPGEVLKEDFMKPLEMTQLQLAERLGVSFRTVNELANCKRAVSPDMALRLGKLFGTGPEVWINLQSNHDLYKAALKAKDALSHISPIAA